MPVIDQGQKTATNGPSSFRLKAAVCSHLCRLQGIEWARDRPGNLKHMGIDHRCLQAVVS